MAETTGRKKNVFRVAKELKVTTPTVLEFLESKEFDVKRKGNQPVTDEMYLALLKKYDFVKYQQQLLEQTSEKERALKFEEDQQRKQAQAELLAARDTSAAPVNPKTKIELPKVQELKVVEQAKPPEKKPKRAKPSKKQVKEEPTVEATQPPVGDTSVVTAELDETPAPDEPQVVQSEEPEVQKRRKIELPQSRSLTIIKAAEPKPVKKAKPAAEKDDSEAKGDKPKKRTRKRKAKPTDETTETVTAPGKKLVRKQAVPQKGATAAKPGVVDDAPTSRRKRKRRGGKGDESAEAGKLVTPVTGKRKSGRSRKKRPQVDQQEVAASVKQTMAQLEKHGVGRKKYAKGGAGKVESSEPEILQVTEFMTTQEFANQIEVPVQDVIKLGLEMGTLISINQRLDRDLTEFLAAEFEVEIEFIQEEELAFEEEAEDSENQTPRQPVVTIMGHVDHGKTTLLDHLRHSRVAEGEAGGITQHIGAYEVNHNGKRLTFLDTPGHEAFTAMRARGAQVTDLVILVVAADDRVMPQTIEAIDHAKAASVPIVIAVNKIDKPEADVQAVYKQLADHNILVESWGGKIQAAEISAKFGKGIDNLLEEVALASDLLELQADATVRARAIVIESQLDRGLGAVATLLIQSGTLRVGDIFVVGQHSGKVRALYNELGKNVEEAIPATPVRVVGFNGVPQAGDRFMVYPSERDAREVSQRRQRQQREYSMHKIKSLSLEQVSSRMRELELAELPLIIKGDVHGSVEVLSDSLMKLSTEEVKVNIIHRGVGGITESDILLAAASGAIVIGFHIHPNPQAREVARREGVEIRIYRVIHEVVDDVRSSLEGLLKPTQAEETIGGLEVRQVFKISRIGTIAGCYVTDGKIGRNSKVRLIRDSTEKWSGELSSLKRFKEDVKEVASGFECGLSLAGFSDIREGDRIEVYKIVETARKLEDSV